MNIEIEYTPPGFRCLPVVLCWREEVWLNEPILVPMLTVRNMGAIASSKRPPFHWLPENLWILHYTAMKQETMSLCHHTLFVSICLVIWNSNSYGTRLTRSAGGLDHRLWPVGELAQQVQHFWKRCGSFLARGRLGSCSCSHGVAGLPLNPLNPLEVDSHTVYIQLARKRVLHGHSGFQRLFGSLWICLVEWVAWVKRQKRISTHSRNGGCLVSSRNHN